MHLLSFHTQLQLCNPTKGKEQALSQLDCREKPFFVQTFLVGDVNIYPGLHLYQEEISGWWFWIVKLGKEGLEDTQPK